MRHKHMVDQRQFRQGKLADTGACIDKDILIQQERSRPVLLSADAAGAAEYAQTHDVLNLGTHRWRQCARGAGNSVMGP